MILRGYDQIRPKVIRLRSAVYTPKGVFEPMHASTWPAYRFPKALPGNEAEIGHPEREHVGAPGLIGTADIERVGLERLPDRRTRLIDGQRQRAGQETPSTRLRCLASQSASRPVRPRP